MLQRVLKGLGAVSVDPSHVQLKLRKVSSFNAYRQCLRIKDRAALDSFIYYDEKPSYYFLFSSLKLNTGAGAAVSAAAAQRTSWSPQSSVSQSPLAEQDSYADKLRALEEAARGYRHLIFYYMQETLNL